MTIRLLCIGKLKERFYADAMAEFAKRMTRYATVEVVELADERAPEQLSSAQREQVKAAEGKRILARVGENDFLVAMDLQGTELTSEDFAQRMQGWMTGGKSRIAFAIGGSLGLSDEVLARADFRLCFGKPTFSHQVFRIMLMEQIYRAFRIINGEPYHK